MSGCSISNSMITCTCSSISSITDTNFPAIQGVFGNKMAFSFKMTMKSSLYMTFANGMCQSLIRSNSALDNLNYWLFGTPIYRQFDIVHDMQSSSIGLKSRGNSEVVQQTMILAEKATALKKVMLTILTLCCVIVTFVI